MEIKITGLGEPIPEIFIREANIAKSKLPDLKVDFGQAPTFSKSYHVDSPLVKYSSETIGGRIEYGNNGLALIGDVVSGIIR